MLPNFLVSERVVREDGFSEALEVPASSTPILLTLGITRIIEQESLEVQLFGSPDGASWGDKPLLRFPQKFYCGVYSLVLDTSGFPETRYIRAQWKVNRWGRGDAKPLFGFYLYAEPANSMAMAAS